MRAHAHSHATAIRTRRDVSTVGAKPDRAHRRRVCDAHARLAVGANGSTRTHTPANVRARSPAYVAVCMCNRGSVCSSTVVDYAKLWVELQQAAMQAVSRAVHAIPACVAAVPEHGKAVGAGRCKHPPVRRVCAREHATRVRAVHGSEDGPVGHARDGERLVVGSSRDTPGKDTWPTGGPSRRWHVRAAPAGRPASAHASSGPESIRLPGMHGTLQCSIRRVAAEPHGALVTYRTGHRERRRQRRSSRSGAAARGGTAASRSSTASPVHTRTWRGCTQVHATQRSVARTVPSAPPCATASSASSREANATSSTASAVRSAAAAAWARVVGPPSTAVSPIAGARACKKCSVTVPSEAPLHPQSSSSESCAAAWLARRQHCQHSLVQSVNGCRAEPSRAEPGRARRSALSYRTSPACLGRAHAMQVVRCTSHVVRCVAHVA